MTTRTLVSGVTKATGIAGRRLVAYGHSYLAADPQNQPGWRYIVQEATRLEPVRFDNYASGGDTSAQCLTIARATWNHDPEAIVVVDCTQNDFRVNDTGSPGQAIFTSNLTRLLDHLRDAYAVLFVEQVYFNQVDYDYMLSEYGVTVDDTVVDTYNDLAAAVVAEHPNAYMVRLNDRGWDPATMSLVRHNTDQGMIFTAWQIDTVLAGVTAPPTLAEPLLDPRTLQWRACWWAEDLGLSNGAQVATWPDGTGNGHDATQATSGNRPTMVTANVAFNNKKTVHFTGSSTQHLRTAAFPTVYQPDTIVMIYKSGSVASMNIIDGIDGVNARQFMRKVGVTNRRITSRTPALNDAVADAQGLTMLTMVFDSPSSIIEVNGVETARGATGVQSLTGLSIGADADNLSPMTGDIAFIGVLPGAINTEEKRLLEGWAASFYGVAVTPDPPVVIDPPPPPDVPGDLAGLDFHTALFASGDWDHPADGGTLDAWPDSSGNDHDAVQAELSKRPLFDLTGLAGKACIRFDGVDDFLAVEWDELPQPYTLIVVGQTDTASTQFFCDGFDASHRSLIRQTGITGYRVHAGANLDTTDRIPDRAVHLLVATIDGADSSLWIDGSEVAAGDAGDQDSAGLTVGASYFGISDFLAGGIGFLGVMAEAITDPDRATLREWAEGFYGITMS